MISGYAMYGPYARLFMAQAVQQEKPWISLSADPNFDWNYRLNVKDLLPSETPPKPTPEMLPRPAPHKEEGQASGYGPGPPPTEFHSAPDRWHIHRRWAQVR